MLHVIRSLRPETGGLVEAVKHLAPALRALGHENTILSLDPADAGRDDPSAIVRGRTSHGWGRSPEYVLWLRDHRSEFDAVIVHGLWQQQSLGAWQALRGTATPYFVFCHGMLDPWFRRAYPLKHVKKWLYWPWADYRVLRDAAGVCFTAESERRAARESFWLYRARELITPLGLEGPRGDTAAQREAFYAEHPTLRQRPFLLFLGRVHPKKGLDDVFGAYARIFGGREGVPLLVVAGPCADAAYLESLKALAARLGIESAVRWLGLVTGEAKWGALHACEAFVLVSHQENFGMAVVEALACERPVLISRQINIWREIVADGAGCAVPDSQAGAVEALSQWQAMQADRRAAMAQAAGECFRKRYAIARAAEHLVETLQAAVRQPPPVATPRTDFPDAGSEQPGPAEV